MEAGRSHLLRLRDSRRHREEQSGVVTEFGGGSAESLGISKFASELAAIQPLQEKGSSPTTSTPNSLRIAFVIAAEAVVISGKVSRQKAAFPSMLFEAIVLRIFSTRQMPFECRGRSQWTRQPMLAESRSRFYSVFSSLQFYGLPVESHTRNRLVFLQSRMPHSLS